MNTETIETEETTTLNTVLTVAGYVAAATIVVISTKQMYTKVKRFRTRRVNEALVEAEAILAETSVDIKSAA